MNSNFLYIVLLFALLIINSISFTVGTLCFEEIWKRKRINPKAIKLHRIFWIFLMFLMGITWGMYIIYPEKFYNNEFVQKCLYIFTIGMVVYGVIGFVFKSYTIKNKSYRQQL